MRTGEVIVAAIALGMLAGCGATTAAMKATETPFVPISHTLSPDSTLPPRAPDSLATEAPTPAPAFLVGTDVATTTGAHITVLKYLDHFASTNQFDSPPAGGFFAALQVKECAGTSGTLDANPYQFELQLADDSRAKPGGVAGGKQPELNDATLQPNECVAGWVSFGVTAKPVRVVLDNSDIRWTIP